MATDDPEELFEILEQLGQGSFGNVYKAIYLPTSQQVALKILRVDQFTNMQSLKQEINLLSHVRSQYIIKMYGTYLKGSNLW